MADWIPWTQRRPLRREYFDAMYTGDAVTEEVLIVCEATRAFVDDHNGTPVYWRPAEPLPPGVDWFDTERGPIFFSDVYSDPDGDPMPLAEQVDELVLQHQMDGGHDIDKKPVEGCPICVALTSLRRLP